MKKCILVMFLNIAFNFFDLKAGVEMMGLNKQLISAVRSKSNETIRQLLKEGASANVFVDSWYQKTALMFAANEGSEEIVRLLLKNEADVDVVDRYGLTALMYAVDSKSKETVELLLENGANINVVDNYYRKTALMRAASKRSKELVELLLKYRADVNVVDNNNGQTALMYAADSGSKDIVKLLLENGAYANSVDNNGKTLLMYAAGSASREIVELLLQNGTDVNAVDHNGKTLLMYATASGSKEIVELLFENGADVSVIDNNGKTLLMYAAGSGSKEIVELLLKNGASVNLVDNDGWTALMYAAHSGSRCAAALLLKNNADINAVSSDGSTAIDCVSNESILQLLKNYKAFKFVPIDQKFDKEPKPEDYIADKKIVAGVTGDAVVSMLDQYNEEYGEQIDAFMKDHTMYWHNKVQIAYREFLFQDNSVPLRRLLTEEIYVKFGLLPEIISFFNSRKDFLYVLNQLKPGATEQELERLQKIITIEEQVEKDIAARKIQRTFRQRKQLQLNKKIKNN